MQLLHSSQYAIRILSYIANHHDKSLYSAKELSIVLDIPYKFLTKIMVDLVNAEFIISIRGRDGGYKLKRLASEITVMEIINSFNEFINNEECILGIGKCDGKHKCSMHDKWVEPKELIHKMFEDTTLENLDGENYKL